MNEKGKKIKIAGSATLTDVDCEYFKSSGSVKVEGNLKADRAKISGSTKVKGDGFVGNLHTSGSFKIHGKTGAENIKVSGSAKFGGDVTAKGKIRVSGSSKFEGNVKAKEVRGSGSFKTKKNVTADKVILTGSFGISDTLKADEINLRFKNKSSVKHIRGGDVLIERGKSGLFSFSKSSLTVKTIKGENIDLEGTKAELVEGETVKIGPGSHIKKVKAKEIDIHEDATVEEKEKREESLQTKDSKQEN